MAAVRDAAIRALATPAASARGPGNLNAGTQVWTRLADYARANRISGSLNAAASATHDAIEATLREVVEALAPIERAPCSPGEREAAEWLAERLRRVDGVQVALEDEPSWGIFQPTLTGLGAAGLLA